MKHKLSDKKKIDKRVEEFVLDCIKKNVDPIQMAEANGIICGDNCDGYPILKHVEQGYDQP